MLWHKWIPREQLMAKRGRSSECGLGSVSSRLLTCATAMCLAAVWPVERAGAQVVRGVVLAASDGAPIGDARLELRDQDGDIRAGFISAENGSFELSADRSGMVRLSVSHIGFADWETANFALGSDAILDVEVRLGVEAIPLEPIVVVARRSDGQSLTAQFERRMLDPGRVGGFFVPAATIEGRPMTSPTNLVLGAPGMSVRLAGHSAGIERQVIMAGQCVARTFIDGVRVQQADGVSIDDLVAPERLAGVEIYPRPLEAPPQYRDAIPPTCGVVLFWTKEPQLDAESGGWGLRRIGVGLGLVAGIITLGLVG